MKQLLLDFEGVAWVAGCDRVCGRGRAARKGDVGRRECQCWGREERHFYASCAARAMTDGDTTCCGPPVSRRGKYLSSEPCRSFHIAGPQLPPTRGGGAVPLDVGGHGGTTARGGWMAWRPRCVWVRSGPTDGTAGARAAWSLLGAVRPAISARYDIDRRDWSPTLAGCETFVGYFNVCE